MGTLSLDSFGQVLAPTWKKCVSGCENQKAANMRDVPSWTQEASGKYAGKTPWEPMSFIAFRPLEIGKKNGSVGRGQKLQCQCGGRQSLSQLVALIATNPFCMENPILR